MWSLIKWRLWRYLDLTGSKSYFTKRIGMWLHWMFTSWFYMSSKVRAFQKNDIVIVLLPIVDHHELPSQFRPIGLCNVAYKIITKLIVNRLKLILPALISNTQSSFVWASNNWQHSHNARSSAYNGEETREKGYMVIKIDFEKAYDRLRWSFMRDTLVQMNLPILLINVIMECLTTTSL